MTLGQEGMSPPILPIAIPSVFVSNLMIMITNNSYLRKCILQKKYQITPPLNKVEVHATCPSHFGHLSVVDQGQYIVIHLLTEMMPSIPNAFVMNLVNDNSSRSSVDVVHPTSAWNGH